MTGPDFARLDECITWALDHPREHDQRTWGTRTACGTTVCIAGRAIITYAPEGAWGWTDDGGWNSYAELIAEGPGEWVQTTHGVQALAADLLGLPEADAEWLFMAADIQGVIEVRDQLAADLGLPEYGYRR